MKIIDRYLLRQFFRVFAMTFISLLGIYVVADFVGNLTEFVDKGKETQSLWQVLGKYYGARVPWFFDVAGRIIALLSAVLALAWLQRDNELTALMAAGISRWRVAKPLLFATALIAILAVVNRELCVPQFRKELCRTAQDLIRNRPDKITPKYDVQTDVLYNGTNIYPLEQRIESPQLLLPVSWSTIGRNLRAASATFHPATESRPSGYLLDHVESATSLADVAKLVVDGEPIAVTMHDDPTLKPDQIFVRSRMSIEQLRRGRQWQQYTATGPLIAGMRNGSLDFSPDLRVMLHARFVQPLLDMTLVFLGLPLAFGQDRGRIVWSATKSMLAISLFSITLLVGHGLGIQCMVSPAMAAWIPLIILVPAAFLFSEPLRR